MNSRPPSRWAETDSDVLFVRGRNAVVASLDAQLRGGDSPEYDRWLEEQFAIARGLVRFRDGSIRQILLQAPSREKLAEAIEHLILAASLVRPTYHEMQSMLETVVEAVTGAFKLHPSLGLRLDKVNEHWEILPPGAAELDKNVIDPNVGLVVCVPCNSDRSSRKSSPAFSG